MIKSIVAVIALAAAVGVGVLTSSVNTLSDEVEALTQRVTEVAQIAVIGFNNDKQMIPIIKAVVLANPELGFTVTENTKTTQENTNNE